MERSGEQLPKGSPILGSPSSQTKIQSYFPIYPTRLVDRLNRNSEDSTNSDCVIVSCGTKKRKHSDSSSSTEEDSSSPEEDCGPTKRPKNNESLSNPPAQVKNYSFVFRTPSAISRRLANASTKESALIQEKENTLLQPKETIREKLISTDKEIAKGKEIVVGKNEATANKEVLKPNKDIVKEPKEKKNMVTQNIPVTLTLISDKSVLKQKENNTANPTRGTTFKDSLSNSTSVGSFYDLKVCESKTTTPKTVEKPVTTTVDKEDSSVQELSSMWSSLLDDSFEDDWFDKPQLSLKDFQRCIVTNVQQESKKQIIDVTDEKHEAVARLQCLGEWSDTEIAKGEVVSIKAEKEGDDWIVDNNKGFLITKPDTLISNTTVLGSLFCSRKTVLMERFRKMEGLPYFKSDEGSAVIGSLVHQILQQALCRKISSQKDIVQIVNDIVKSRDTAVALYACKMSSKKCREEIISFVPKIFNFIQHYVKGNTQKAIEDDRTNFKGSITEIRDIEENIWLPKLGLKGKIDVTAQVKIHGRKSIAPLEIKTGKPSFSHEHKGQIILYIMMMALTGQDVDTGLLLYIRANSMQEVRSRHSDRRGLIGIRNTLANYFTPKAVNNVLEIENAGDLPRMELPEPINHDIFCKQCLYNTLCCTYLSKDKKRELPAPLEDVSRKVLEKLDPAHIDYVLRWVSLLQLEEHDQAGENKAKDLWTLSAEKRENRGSCIANLLVSNSVRNDNKFLHSFSHYDIEFKGFSSEAIGNFSENDYVIISTDTRTNIAAGFIIRLDTEEIVVMLDRNLAKYPDTKFHLDKYTYSNVNALSYANLAGLLHDDLTCEKLRRIIIEKEPATFEKGLDKSKMSKYAKHMKNLNKEQSEAVLKALLAKDYMLIKGMPGTGKTQTLVALILALNELRCSVLVTAHTHSAVDNILTKLSQKGVDFLRLGSINSIRPSLKAYSESYVTAKCTTPEDLEEVYESKNIVGVTCCGAHHALLGKKIFDYCIIDESTQAMQPTILRPLFNAKVFILAGDPDQLPPVIKSVAARKLGADETLFARLDSQNNTMVLRRQYRMNQSIMHLANKLTYCDKLTAGNEGVNCATYVAFVERNLPEDEIWQRNVLSRNMDKAVIVLDTGCTYNLRNDEKLLEKYPQDSKMYSNIWEAAIILQLSETLAHMSVDRERIGVIAPYKAHVQLLRKVLDSDIEVNTVDQYQGRDKDIIFYTCARSFASSSDTDEKKRDGEILEDHRRLTVAITRAKHKLIVVADRFSVIKYTPFKKLFEIVGEEKILELKDGRDGFSWKNVTSCL